MNFKIRPLQGDYSINYQTNCLCFQKHCEYGIRATIFIAAESLKNNRVGQKEIAEEIDSPVAFTAKILQKLVHRNIVSSAKGVGGGFSIDKNRLKDIRLVEIVEAIDGDSIFRGCGLGLSDCSEDHPLSKLIQFKSIRGELTVMLEDTTLEELALGIK